MKTTLPGIDPDLIRRYLDERAGDEYAIDVRLLEGGRSNVSYLITRNGRRLVLRRPPLGNILPSAHDMRREFRVLSGLASVEFPVPRPLAYEDDRRIMDAPLLLMDFVDGIVISDAAAASALSAQDADQVSRSLVDTLARLHATDVRAAGLGELGRPEGYLDRQVERWQQQWQRTKTRELAAMDELGAWLRDRVPRVSANRGWSLVHGDYRLDNVILDAGDLSVRAVLDWEMATLGDPVSDLAVALVYWTEAADGLRRRVPVAEDVTSGPGFWTRPRVVAEYADRTGLDLSHLDECIALACFKLAVIMESIHKRTIDGLQLGAAATGGSMGEATSALAQLGLAAASGGVRALGV